MRIQSIRGKLRELGLKLGQGWNLNHFHLWVSPNKPLDNPLVLLRSERTGRVHDVTTLDQTVVRIPKNSPLPTDVHIDRIRNECVWRIVSLRHQGLPRTRRIADDQIKALLVPA